MCPVFWLMEKKLVISHLGMSESPHSFPAAIQVCLNKNLAHLTRSLIEC